VVGFALAGGGTNYSLAQALGGGRSDLFQAGVFARHRVGPAYVSAALAYGWQDVTTNRTVTAAGTDQLQARFNANTLAARLETGYRWAMAGGGVTPYAAVQSISIFLPGYSESATAGSNAFALSYGAQTVTAPRTELGARADRSFAAGGGTLVLRGRVAWAHDFETDRPINATFQTLPGAAFTVNGASPAPNAALLSAGAEMRWPSGWSMAATFEGEFSRNTDGYAGRGTIRRVW
jgi:outer membrane autotransporter protein